jgi:hypothetical protein
VHYNQRCTVHITVQGLFFRCDFEGIVANACGDNSAGQCAGQPKDK